MEDFNDSLSLRLKAVIDPRAALFVDRSLSHEDKIIQPADMFARGVFRKYGRRERECYRPFGGKTAFETVHSP